MRALAMYAGFVIACNAAGIFVGSFIERHTSPNIGLIVILGMFFVSLVVSWIATVFVMDGSLNNFFAEQEQIEADRKGREYMNCSNATLQTGQRPYAQPRSLGRKSGCACLAGLAWAKASVRRKAAQPGSSTWALASGGLEKALSTFPVRPLKRTLTAIG